MFKIFCYSMFVGFRYEVAIFTSSKQEMPVDASISIILSGEEGSTEAHELTDSRTSDSLWCPGQCDVFLLESHSVGQLKDVRLQFNERGENHIRGQ